MLHLFWAVMPGNFSRRCYPGSRCKEGGGGTYVLVPLEQIPWEQVNPRPADTRMSWQPSREGALPGNGLCPQLPSQGLFLGRNNCQPLHCRRFLMNKSGFLLQIQVNDTQSPQHLSWGLRAERSQCLVHWVGLVSALPFKHLCTLRNSGLCRFQGCFWEEVHLCWILVLF